jgi:hypothetical protein
VHESHDDDRAVVCVLHSPQVPPPDPELDELDPELDELDPELDELDPPEQAGAGLTVGTGQSLYVKPPCFV